MKFMNGINVPGLKGINTTLQDAPPSGLEPIKGADVGQIVPPHRTVDPETDKIVRVPAQIVTDDFGNTAIPVSDIGGEPITDLKEFAAYLLAHVKELRLHVPNPNDNLQTLATATDAFQKAFIQRALEQNHHSVPAAASTLGVSRVGLYKMLHRHGLTPGLDRDILKNPKPR